VVKEGEDLIKIAKEQKLCDYILIEMNDEVDDYDDVKAGQIIQIPNVYAKKNIIYIDKKLHLPVRMEMFDDDGFFERYELSNIRVNPIIPQDEFSASYKDYGY
jgi:outer membrane lipoprotein-sorting protein